MDFAPGVYSGDGVGSRDRTGAAHGLRQRLPCFTQKAGAARVQSKEHGGLLRLTQASEWMNIKMLHTTEETLGEVVVPREVSDSTQGTGKVFQSRQL